MADAKKQRALLNEYTYAVRYMELADVAINTLALCNTREAEKAVAILNKGQQRLLKRMDAAAAKLGAPYTQPKESQHDH